ncbi:hypothetical protein PFISCL1PPCAC_21880, partial [Pristionchus fissidentatus]
DKWPSFDCISERIHILSNFFEIENLMIWADEGTSVANFRDIIELCKGMRCDVLTIGVSDQACSQSLTDESLRELISNKESVKIYDPCERITLAGLLALWEDLLCGKFDGLSIPVEKFVVTKLFDLIRTDGKKSSLKEKNMEPV